MTREAAVYAVGVRLVVVLALLLGAAPARADGPAQGAGADQASRPRPDVDVVIPVEPYEHERLHWFGRRGHHLVPGTVTIDQEPYRCDVDKLRFRKEDEFVAHVRTAHRVPEDAIPGTLVVRDGLVHFIGTSGR